MDHGAQRLPRQRPLHGFAFLADRRGAPHRHGDADQEHRQQHRGDERDVRRLVGEPSLCHDDAFDQKRGTGGGPHPAQPARETAPGRQCQAQREQGDAVAQVEKSAQSLLQRTDPIRDQERGGLVGRTVGDGPGVDGGLGSIASRSVSVSSGPTAVSTLAADQAAAATFDDTRSRDEDWCLDGGLGVGQCEGAGDPRPG